MYLRDLWRPSSRRECFICQKLGSQAMKMPSEIDTELEEILRMELIFDTVCLLRAAVYIAQYFGGCVLPAPVEPLDNLVGVEVTSA